MTSALEKILRLTAPPEESEPDRIRSLTQAVTVALTMACEASDPCEAARMTLAARKLAGELSDLLYTEGMAREPADVRIVASAPRPDKTHVADASSSVMEDLASGQGVVFLAAPPPGSQDIPMHHAPFTGTHSHAHSVTMAHGHDHSHQDDNSHGSPVHGNNAGQKAWAAKGQSRRMDY
jgi:hypothetical protein